MVPLGEPWHSSPHPMEPWHSSIHSREAPAQIPQPLGEPWLYSYIQLSPQDLPKPLQLLAGSEGF